MRIVRRVYLRSEQYLSEHNALFYFLSTSRRERGRARVFGDNDETKKKLVCGRTDLKVKYLSKQVVATFFDLVNRYIFYFFS